MNVTTARRTIVRLLASAAIVLGPGGGWAHADSVRDPSPVPTPPAGTRVRVISTFDEGEQEPVRIAAQPVTERLYVLGGGGDVYLLDVVAGTKRRVLTGRDFIEQPKQQNVNIPLPVDAAVVNSPITLRATLCLGLTFDRDGRLYLVANVQIPGKVYTNRVSLYRTTPVGKEGLPSAPFLWTQFDYPYGVGGFNHGARPDREGPDGMIYLGIRTTDQEPGPGRAARDQSPVQPGSAFRPRRTDLLSHRQAAQTLREQLLSAHASATWSITTGSALTF